MNDRIAGVLIVCGLILLVLGLVTFFILPAGGGAIALSGLAAIFIAFASFNQD